VAAIHGSRGVTSGHQNPYRLALQQLDSDGSQYISSNTLDERSHASFLNAYPIAKGQEPVGLDAFHTLPSSQATGAPQIGGLTYLMQLSVNTSWYVRYRSTTNPDFGTFEQALLWLAAGQITRFPGQTRTSGPPRTSRRLQRGGVSLWVNRARRLQ